MIKGVGIDTASVATTARLMEALGDSYLEHVFTAAERAAARDTRAPVEYLTARFAAKEATFKALAHLTSARTFDMRCVETLDEADGHPVIQANADLRRVMDAAEVDTLLVSLTVEGDHATSIVVAGSESVS